MNNENNTKKFTVGKAASVAGIVGAVFSMISAIGSLIYTIWLAKRTKKSNEEIGTAAGEAYYQCGHPAYKKTVSKHKNAKSK